jgi:hypothetical protein
MGQRKRDCNHLLIGWLLFVLQRFTIL